MTRWMMGMCAAVTAGAAVGAVQARQDVGNAPGMPTIAQTYVLNRGADEALPVTLTAGGDVLPVEVVGQPLVRLVADGGLPTRAVRQAWEYRQLAVAAQEELAAALEEAGAAGWEAVSVLTLGPGRSAVLLKRPQ